MEFLILFLLFVVGFIVGAKTMNLFHQQMIRQILKELGITPDQLKQVEHKLMAELETQDPELAQRLRSEHEPKLPTMQITLEQHQGTLFAYRADTKEFVGQGVDQATLAQSIAHRFKGVRVEILNGELLQKSHT